MPCTLVRCQPTKPCAVVRSSGPGFESCRDAQPESRVRPGATVRRLTGDDLGAYILPVLRKGCVHVFAVLHHGEHPVMVAAVDVGVVRDEERVVGRSAHVQKVTACVRTLDTQGVRDFPRPSGEPSFSTLEARVPWPGGSCRIVMTVLRNLVPYARVPASGAH
eukprot:scaffold11696_cov93-Phaeocystis_antarctica.AAC.2